MDFPTSYRLTMRAVDRWVRGPFSGIFLGFEFSPFRQRISALPPATNASRWKTISKPADMNEGKNGETNELEHTNKNWGPRWERSRTCCAANS
jgi:hypothetical protein